MLGDTIKDFKIVGRLGKGGMGEVWVAEQQIIKTRVAIKVLLADVSSDAGHVQRFFNEALAVSTIKHAGIVRIFDVGFHASRAFLIMELLDGETLASRIARSGRLSIGETADVARQIASVLQATHAAGVTHRDLKPDNVFMVPDSELASGERVKILDFGIAKLGTTGLTATGKSMGTPSYMAPEQWRDAATADGRTDLYALGCVMFEMCCGRPPFIAASIGEACTKHLTEPPPRVALRADVPQELDELIAKMLAKQPADRPSLKEVAGVLAAIAASQPLPLAATMQSTYTAPATRQTTTLGGAAASVEAAPRKPRGWLAGGAVALAIAGIAAAVAVPRLRDAEPEASRSFPIALDLGDGVRFTAHYRIELLRWSPAPTSGSDELELEHTDPGGTTTRLAAPAGADYLRVPWQIVDEHPGHYRVRVVRGDASSAWVAFSYFPDTLARIRADGELRLGIERVQHAPFVAWDAVKRDYVGFDIDLVRALVAAIAPSAKLTLVPSDWATLVPAQAFDETHAPAFDIVASAVSVTEDRCQRFAFSRPYLRTGQRVLRRCGGGSGTTVGVQRGTTSETAGRAFVERTPGATLKVIDSNDHVFDALKQRAVDEIFVDDLLAAARPETLAKPPEWCFDGERRTDEDYAIEIPQREVELAGELDRALDALAANGTLARLARDHGLPAQALEVTGRSCSR